MCKFELLLGDCYKIIPTINCNIDCVITDPPYHFPDGVRGGGLFSSDQSKYKRGVRKVLDNLEKLNSTVFNPNIFLDLLKSKMKKFYGYFFCNKTLISSYINWAEKNNFIYDLLTLIKQNPIPAHSTHHMSDIEYIVLIRDKGTFFNGKDCSFDDYRKWFLKTCKKQLHPAEKPVELLSRFIKVSCKKGSLILDAFMGSGSTGIAALESNCRFIGIEKDKDCFELASKRIQETENDINGIGTMFEGIL